ncbi:KaiC domain-containing protein [Halorubrum sp. Hd13]|uniref:KaiC domain-containing protein n=1 Tax=Halorubrum sp. Hd13 TaxID=1480728 RepID=UPI000B98E18E|nr:KaiC domain-containing protein [Halorubrum sp. Hd13]OYR41941.1 KaiC domain-containing protein [Halorubrum sp. Hd13]
MSEEDDWFERALRDLDDESDRSGDAEADDLGSEDAETDDAEAVGDDAETDDAEAVGDDAEAVGDESGSDEAPDRGEGDDPFGGVRDGTDETDETGPEGGDDGGAESDSLGGGSFGDDDPFGGREFGEPGSPGEATGEDFGGGDDFGGGEDFGGEEFSEDDFGGGDDLGDDDFGGDAFGDPDPSGADESAGDPLGGATGPDGDDPFGGGSFGEDDPFGGYRNRAPGGSDGFGEFGGGDGAGGAGGAGGAEPGFDVDPDEFESSIERTDVGIEGLDEMILGGVPRRSLLSVIGGAGTGKTTFALQFLNEALESGGKGVYITLEQTRESILSTASEKGWTFRDHADEGRLAVVAIDPIEMANSLASIRNDLIRLIADFDADRLVLDSVSLLEMMYDHPAKRRSEVFGFTRSLKEAGVTTLLTSEASEENPYASRHGIVEYLTDAVFVLQYIRGSDFRETRLAVEIQKIRDANHSRETKPYEITDTGISVYGQANIF